MDTSSFTTLDFMLGQGINLPAPTDLEFAKLLEIVALRLQPYASNLIGNKPYNTNENWMLKEVIESLTPVDATFYKELRAVMLKAFPTRYGNDLSRAGHHYLYIACSRNRVYWLQVDRLDKLQALKPKMTVRVMDETAWLELFSEYSDYAVHIAIQLIRKLAVLADTERMNYLTKACQLDDACAALERIAADARSACDIPRRGGDGIEG